MFSILCEVFTLWSCYSRVEKLSAVLLLCPPMYHPPCIQCTSEIMELLEVAKSSIPPSMWNITPVVLKATAGLRLLPGEKAKHLLDTVRHTHTSSTTQHNTVSGYLLFTVSTGLHIQKIPGLIPEKQNKMQNDKKETHNDQTQMQNFWNERFKETETVLLKYDVAKQQIIWSEKLKHENIWLLLNYFSWWMTMIIRVVASYFLSPTKRWWIWCLL